VGDAGHTLVLGAGGFFGGWIRRAFEAEGGRVTSPARNRLDLTDPGAVAAAVAAAGPDVIVNAAGMSSPRACREDPAGCFEANVAGTFNLLEAVAAEATGARLVLFSSAAVYGPGAGEPLTEEDLPAPHSAYGASKLAAEVLTGQYVREGRLEATTLRVFNLIGPGQPTSQAAAGFAAEVRAALKAGRTSVRIPVGNPETARDFTDVREAARAVALAAAAPAAANRIFNLCSGHLVSLGDLARAFDRLAGERSGRPFRVRLRPDQGRVIPGDPFTLCGSCDRLREATGWRPCVPLAESLSDLLFADLPAG